MPDPRGSHGGVHNTRRVGGGGLGTCPICADRMPGAQLRDHIAEHGVADD